MIPNLTEPKVCILGKGGIDIHFSVQVRFWSSFSTDVKPCAHCAAVNAQSTAGVGWLHRQSHPVKLCTSHGDVFAAPSLGESLFQEPVVQCLADTSLFCPDPSRETQGLYMAVRTVLYMQLVYIVL